MTELLNLTIAPMRILQLASHDDLCRGGAVQMVRLASGLQRLNHTVVCAFNRPADSMNGAEFAPLRSQGIETVGFELGRRREMWRFRRWCRERGFQVLHAHRDPATVFACQALLGLRAPVIVAGRGTVYGLKPLTLPWLCFRSGKVRRVIAVADAVRQALMGCGVWGGKIDVVYGGVEEEEFRPGLDGAANRTAWSNGTGAPLVGNVAALVPKKGHEIFFRAAVRVRARIPECRFVCVGDGAPARFDGLLAELNLRDAVIFTGHRTDMPQVMGALDVVVCSSFKGEGLTGSIREAMACGRPVVVTDVGGNRELVHDGDNGRLVPVGDPDALAESIVLLLVEPERARRLGEAARATICERFTNRARCERIASIYRSLVSGATQ